MLIWAPTDMVTFSFIVCSTHSLFLRLALLRALIPFLLADSALQGFRPRHILPDFSGFLKLGAKSIIPWPFHFTLVFLFHFTRAHVNDTAKLGRLTRVWSWPLLLICGGLYTSVMVFSIVSLTQAFEKRVSMGGYLHQVGLRT